MAHPARLQQLHLHRDVPISLLSERNYIKRKGEKKAHRAASSGGQLPPTALRFVSNSARHLAASAAELHLCPRRGRQAGSIPRLSEPSSGQADSQQRRNINPVTPTRRFFWTISAGFNRAREVAPCTNGTNASSFKKKKKNHNFKPKTVSVLFLILFLRVFF